MVVVCMKKYDSEWWADDASKLKVSESWWSQLRSFGLWMVKFLWFKGFWKNEVLGYQSARRRSHSDEVCWCTVLQLFHRVLIRNYCKKDWLWQTPLLVTVLQHTIWRYAIHHMYVHVHCTYRQYNYVHYAYLLLVILIIKWPCLW